MCAAAVAISCEMTENKWIHLDALRTNGMNVTSPSHAVCSAHPFIRHVQYAPFAQFRMPNARQHKHRCKFVFAVRRDKHPSDKNKLFCAVRRRCRGKKTARAIVSSNRSAVVCVCACALFVCRVHKIAQMKLCTHTHTRHSRPP